jgi:hypothetical protein
MTIVPVVRRPSKAVLLCGLLAACGGGGATTSPPPPVPMARTWQIGMATLPPVLTVESVLAGIEQWSPYAELAAFHEELPWTDLLAGMTPAAILLRDKVDLVAYLRSRGLGIAFTADLTDGLSRTDEAPQLRALGRSLTEPAVQQLARDYVLAVDELLQPEYLGLAAETNLVRASAPSGLYAAVVDTANAMAQDLQAAATTATLFFSVQVETAWGWGSGGTFVGIAQDLTDFPFAQVLGLSSYPYFVHTTPDTIPDDYYRRLVAGTSLPAMVTEGGWSSASVGAGASSPQLQARYLERQEELLDSVSAVAFLHLLYADPDLTTWPQPIPPNLPFFVNIGLADSEFAPKPALDVWQQMSARPLSR